MNLFKYLIIILAGGLTTFLLGLITTKIIKRIFFLLYSN